MEFMLDAGQRLLQESVARFLDTDCPLDRVREVAEAEETRARDVHQGLCELDLAGIVIPEAYGGVGMGYLEAALIAECLGFSVTPVPYAATAVMAPTALAIAGTDDQKRQWLPKIASGEKIVGVGVSEFVGRRETDGVAASGGRLNGKAMFVLEAMEADAYVIADQTGAMHLVTNDADGLQRRKLNTIDRTRSVAELTFNGTPAELLPGSAADQTAIRQTIDAGRLMLAADTLGASQNMLNQSIAYAKERRQFNRPIGSFQAVKHMCAEMAAELEPCRSLVWYAAHAADAIPDQSRLMICHAKTHLAEIGQFVARTSTEVHGGMGFTDLLGLHYWFKRIGFNRQLLGAPELVREEAAAIQGLVGAS